MDGTERQPRHASGPGCNEAALALAARALGAVFRDSRSGDLHLGAMRTEALRRGDYALAAAITELEVLRCRARR